MKKKEKSYWFGIFAEYYVVFILFFKGYKFLKRRFKTKLGEVDLIFKKGRSLIGIEVKARSNPESYDIEEVCHKGQFYRISNSLKIFLNKNEKYSNFYIRIDFFLVYRNLKFIHIKNVWNE